MSGESCARLVYAVQNITDYVHAVLGERCLTTSIVAPTVVVYVLILILGLFGNICTCTVIARNSSMHNPTNYYLFSLAISDLLILVMGLPMELHDVLDSAYPYKFGVLVCKLRAFVVEFTSYASILTISAFTIERWVAICFPLKLRVCLSLDRVFKVIGIAWAIAFAAALPMAFIVKVNRIALPVADDSEQSWTRLVSNDGATIMNTDFCAMDIERPRAQKLLIYFAFTAFFLMPAILITVAYCHIGIQLRTADRYLSQSDNFGKTTRARKSVIQILVSVVVSFFLCWLPFHLQRLLSISLAESGGDVNPALQTLFTSVFYISGCCYYSNSACNPIIYNILSEKYRRAFLKTIFGKTLSKRLFGLRGSVNMEPTRSQCRAHPGSPISYKDSSSGGRSIARLSLASKANRAPSAVIPRHSSSGNDPGSSATYLHVPV
ncbi:Neuropeptides capa receptor [Toxocara canis]|uniref:Neuropeptides capa receptor n=1 Tax=Toxocara canis TaxID=6265 RepID=A0A0B2VCM2_TOXCA|nr:Neuropeptides capa receptor [Toxocara canis]